MNNGRIWCVVNPTVGLPAFLGSVALISFTVHFAVLNNTTWMKDFYQGTAVKTAAAEETVAPVAATSQSGAPAFVINVTPTNASGKEPASFTVTVTPSDSQRVSGDLAMSTAPQR
jgi:light-harvesting protein B-800-850 alpha chain